MSASISSTAASRVDLHVGAVGDVRCCLLEDLGELRVLRRRGPDDAFGGGVVPEDREGRTLLPLARERAASLRAGMLVRDSANSAICWGCETKSMKAFAPSGWSQVLEIDHCHEPAPIFGPFPKSGAGRNRTSSPRASIVLAAAQSPIHCMP